MEDIATQAAGGILDALGLGMMAFGIMGAVTLLWAVILWLIVHLILNALE